MSLEPLFCGQHNSSYIMIKEEVCGEGKVLESACVQKDQDPVFS
jgi:hypothetical protein